MHRLPTFLAALFALAFAAPIAAQVVPEGPVLAAADLREGQSLDGEWTWSVDPFRDGMAGFHGAEAGQGYRRYDDVDVETRSSSDPIALYEYDLDRSATVKLPSSWMTHAPEMRHYKGLVWYQKRFDAVTSPGERQFLRFGAADYAADVWLNGKKVGRHEGGFTPFAFEVTGLLRGTGNRLVVGVDSERDALSIPPPVTDWENLRRNYPARQSDFGAGDVCRRRLGAPGGPVDHRRRRGARWASGCWRAGHIPHPGAAG